MGWKRVVIGGTLLGAGFFTMFDYLIMDLDVRSSLDQSDTGFVSYLAIFNKQYYTLEEYKKRKTLFL